jgi:LysR family transcriptional activator of nhaA
MEWLNYHHLLYFWVVAKEGSIVRASEELRLAHPTISGQIHRLEEVLGEKLFTRRGRHLVLTEAGRVAFRYADEIFSLGREFVDTLKGRASGRPLRLVVGVADVLPPSLVRRFLEPAFRLGQAVRVICRADKSVEEFIAELALHRVDVVIADGPAGPGIPIRAFSHLLGECGTTFFAAAKLAASTRRKFPRSLDGTPFLLPGAPSAVRRALNSTTAHWQRTSGKKEWVSSPHPRSSRPRSDTTIGYEWSGGLKPCASISMPSRSSARSNTPPW